MSTRFRPHFPATSGLLVLFALAGCTAESATLCKDGFALSSDETEAYEATTAKLTIERPSVAPLTYQVANDGAPEKDVEVAYVFRMQPTEQLFEVTAKGSSAIVSFGRWEIRANSDTVDLDVYSCDYGGKIVDKNLPLLPSVAAIQHAACQLEDGTIRSAAHRTATGQFQQSLEGHLFLSAKGPSVSLDLVRFSRPAASSVSSDTCVLQP